MSWSSSTLTPSDRSRATPSVVLSDADSSLLTLTPSLHDNLFKTNAAGLRVQALNNDYNWPADSRAVRCELLAAKVLELLYEDTGLYFEPQRGRLADILSTEDSKVLDMGSGATASWSISMAERFPECSVFGLDLVPCELSYLPPNVSLEVWDLLNGLPFPDNHFALIHSRGTMTSAFLDDGKGATNLLHDVARCLRPGGVFILEEGDKLFESSSRDPSHPHLRLAQTQVDLCVARFANSKSKQERLMRWPREMADVVKNTAGFGNVCATGLKAGLGRRQGAAETENVIRLLTREVWLLNFELSRLGADEGEQEEEEAKRLEELAIPLEDVGLSATIRVVWAEKAIVKMET